jgi:O-antigen/teichoic acid export membrane protein
VRSRKFVTDSLWLAGGQVGRTVLQAAYFVLLARALGVRDYGALVAVLAIISILNPFSGLGVITLLVKNISRRPEQAAPEWATARMVTVLSGSILSMIAVVASSAIGPEEVSHWAFAALALSELILARLIDVAATVYQAQRKMRRTAFYPIYLVLARLTGAVALILSPLAVDVLTWAMVQLLTTGPVAFVIMAFTTRSLGSAPARLGDFARAWREGLLYSVSLSSQSIYNDIDKTMLARLSSLADAGTYTAAYRLVDMGHTPIRAAMAAAFPSMFAHGEAGLRSALAITRRLCWPVLVYACLAGMTLLLVAPLLPIVLGHDFSGSVGALQGLAALPLLRAAHQLPADALTGSGFQGRRTLIQIIVALANVGANLVLIPQHGVAGAVAASLASETALAIGLWSAVYFSLESSPRAARSAGADT